MSPTPPREDRGTCTPCRGTGRLVSTLGGEAHEVRCPWCEGSGRFRPGHDAQEAGPAESQGPVGEGKRP